jgi:hypothetical protein
MSGPSPLANLYKVSFSGEIGANEIFVYSLWTTAADSFLQEFVIDNYTGDVADLLATSVTSGGVPTLESAFPDYVNWTQIKCSPWDTTTDKLQAGQTPAYRTIAENGNGSAGSGLPDQCALAITTRSAVAGRRKYNRFYLPPLTINATDGRGILGSAEADAFVLWRHLNITSHATAGDNQCNYNPHGPSGVVHPILDIYLGRRLDVIRRRANHEPEPRTVDAL